MKNLRRSLRELAVSLLPTTRTVIRDSRYEPQAIAHTLDVNRLHTILRSAEGGDTRDLFAVYRDLILADGHTQSQFSTPSLNQPSTDPSIIFYLRCQRSKEKKRGVAARSAVQAGARA